MLIDGDNSPNSLTRLLVETQKSQRLSMAELARRIGCHRSLLYRWLNGQCVPQKTVHLQGIARTCSCDFQSILELTADTSREKPATDHHWKQLDATFAQVQHPDDLTPALANLAEIFQTEQVSFFLRSPTSVCCLWCAGSHPFDPTRIGSYIQLYHRVTDWSSSTPKTEEEAIARAFVTRKPTEFAEVHLLRPGVWLVACPLSYGEHPLGCLVLSSSKPMFLAPAEVARLSQVCHLLAGAVVRYREPFDQLGREKATRILADLYREVYGQVPPPLEGKSALAALSEQAEKLGRILRTIARQFRLTGIPFHDLSLQQIDADAGAILAQGTDHHRFVLPPALLDITTATSCWEAFKADKILYRPDLSRQDQYHEGDFASTQPVMAMVDIPFFWEECQGTVGINSLTPHPWSEHDLDAFATLVRRFGPGRPIPP